MSELEEKISPKKDKKYYLELFSTLKNYLTKLSYCSTFLSDLSSEEEESIEFIISSLTLLRKLNELSGKTQNLTELFNKFKEAFPKKIENEKINELLVSFNNSSKKAFELEGEEELEDEVNYIYIWTLNSYQLDLKSATLDEIKKKFGEFAKEVTLDVEEESETTQEEVKCCGSSKEKEVSCNSKSWSGYSVYRNLFKTERWSFGNSNLDKDEDSFEYIVSRTQALERLERDIRKGRVYIYSTKPIGNLKWKRILSWLLLAGAVVSSIAFMKSLVSGGGTSSNFGGPTLFSLMSFLFFVFSRRENNRFSENENFKYCFSKRIFYYYFFLATFFVFTEGGDYAKLLNDNGSYKTFQMLIFIPLISLLISSIVIFLTGFFFLNPKKNKALIENLLNKYSNPPYLNN